MSSIINTVKKAFSLVSEKYPLVYWNIDLHGVCFQSNYTNSEYLWINEDCVKCLKAITDNPISRLILWSSCHEHEQIKIKEFMSSYGIRVDFFNENPLVENTSYADFSKKYYFSILLDDKAGFEPEKDWYDIYMFVENENKIIPSLSPELLENPLINKAYHFALYKHLEVGQFRKNSKLPYIVHPVSVAMILYTLVPDVTVEMLCAALLHDTIEDTNTTFDEIVEHFGMQIALLVEMLTDVSTKEDGNRAVRKRIDLAHTAIASPIAKTIKLADTIHNSYNIGLYHKKFAPVYMAEKVQFLNVLTEGNSVLYGIANDILIAYNEGSNIKDIPSLSKIKQFLGC